jgi:hypothetical protein
MLFVVVIPVSRSPSLSRSVRFSYEPETEAVSIVHPLEVGVLSEMTIQCDLSKNNGSTQIFCELGSNGNL